MTTPDLRNDIYWLRSIYGRLVQMAGGIAPATDQVEQRGETFWLKNIYDQLASSAGISTAGLASGDMLYWNGSAIVRTPKVSYVADVLTIGTAGDGVTERVRIAGQGTVNYHIVTDAATFNGVVEGLLIIGANVAGTAGAKIDPTKPSAAWYIEDGFRYTATETASEFYMGFFSPANVERRPLQSVVDWATNNVIVTITGAVVFNKSNSQTAHVTIPDGEGIYQIGKALRVDHSQQLDLRNADALSILAITASGAGAGASFKIASPAAYDNDLVLGVAGADWMRFYGAVNGVRFYKPNWQFQAGAEVIVETIDANDYVLRRNSAEVIRLTAAGLQVAAGKNFVLDTVTGSMFGTASTQKQAWWGATPIVRPTVSGARNLPESALRNLLTALATMGLVVDSTTAI